MSLNLYRSNNNELNKIADKIILRTRINTDEAIFLYQNAELAFLGILANWVKEFFTKKNVFYNKNLHLETTNQCIYNCKFCSYSAKTQSEAWKYNKTEIIKKIYNVADQNITEVHITGGVHEDLNLNFYIDLISTIKTRFPHLHIKALTATEIDFLASLNRSSIVETLMLLKNAGLNSLPGGGAEIFEDGIRKKICANKTNGKKWLEIHEIAHHLGIFSNATMLYGHLENITDRLNHMELLRTLQDKTKGFRCFIPLKFRNSNNQLSYVKELSSIDDLKTYAISRIFLDNFTHIKAYWPMIGKDIAQLSLSFGVDDLDGTINNSTKIYSKAGAEETNPSMSSHQVCELIEKTNRIPIERDSDYNAVIK